MSMAAVSRSDVVDPRIERSREVVLAAALELLTEVGFGDLTIEAVAARSGVAKSTIYRHWHGKLDLVASAFAELKSDSQTVPAPGPVRQRVVEILTELAVHVQDPTWRRACLPALIEASARCPEVAELSRQVAEMGAAPLVQVLDEAVAAEELRLPAGATTADLADALVGPILLRALFHRDHLDPGDVPALVDLVLPGP
jgi:TetR/AcrR family transcriptional regulator of autoinduction and epiphytic fitness